VPCIEGTSDGTSASLQYARVNASIAQKVSEHVDDFMVESGSIAMEDVLI
jgi:hypothetical protein